MRDLMTMIQLSEDLDGRRPSWVRDMDTAAPRHVSVLEKESRTDVSHLLTAALSGPVKRLTPEEYLRRKAAEVTVRAS